MTTAFATSAPGTVVESARAELLGLLDVLWAAKRPDDLTATVAGIEKLRSVIDAVELAVLVEMEATNAAAVEGWASTKDFLTAVSGGHKGAGSAMVRLAKAVAGDRGRVAEELANGRISRAQAQVVVDTVERLPVKDSLRSKAEEWMLEHARTLDATDLAKAGRHLVAVMDPEGDERREERRLAREERAAHLGRFLSITDDGAGGVRIKGRTTVEDAAAIKAALLPLAAPQPSAPGACGGRGPDRGCVESGCAHDGRDPRDHGARFLDALVEGCRRLLGTETLPSEHGSTPRINLTMSYSDLRDLCGSATLDTGENLSASAVRRMACDADLIPLVLGSASEVLDVGRTQRLVTAAIWKALVVRDRHCTFPGCSRPPIMCDAHHVQHWLDGGPTSLENLTLLCRAHHQMIHASPWEVRMNPIDRRPEFIPPARLDPQQRPMRQRHPRE